MNSPENKSQNLKVWAVSTITLGAFLLFQIQPMITKMILPRFGSSPMVWVTALLFFQALLVFGYLYSHFLSKLAIKQQVILHIFILCFSIIALPIKPSHEWQPAFHTTEPIFQILLLLFSSTGFPYFMLATTTPLVQSWYTLLSDDDKPFKLFAWSNFSSLAALITYPFIAEPLFSLSMQSYFWSILFLLYIATLSFKPASIILKSKFFNLKTNALEHKNPIKATTKAIWILAPAWATLNLAAITNHLSQDISSIPFIWITPLVVYLITFIQNFKHENPLALTPYALVMIVIICILSLSQQSTIPLFITSNGPIHFPNITKSLTAEVLIFLGLLYTSGMICHGIAFRTKPKAEQSTIYYIYLTIGGCAGTFIVSVICPFVFNSFMELNYAILFNAVIASVVIIKKSRLWEKSKLIRFFLPILLIVNLALTWWTYIHIESTENYEYKRNFFGVLSIYESPYKEKPYRTFFHGRIIHGMQYMGPEIQKQALTYYAKNSGIELLFNAIKLKENKNIAVLGLGAGTLATYGQKGDFYKFYEINPFAIELCTKYFTYLQKSSAKCEIALGDGRLLMEAEKGSLLYDVIVLDAFTGDAIPLHLLTSEAFDIYQRSLQKDGSIMIQITNKHINLLPILQRMAEEKGFQLIQIKKRAIENLEFSSNWVILTKNQALLDDPTINSKKSPQNSNTSLAPVWTDEKNSLLDVLWK